jgi:hypothetical protein
VAHTVSAHERGLVKIKVNACKNVFTVSAVFGKRGNVHFSQIQDLLVKFAKGDTPPFDFYKIGRKK